MGAGSNRNLGHKEGWPQFHHRCRTSCWCSFYIQLVDSSAPSNYPYGCALCAASSSNCWFKIVRCSRIFNEILLQIPGWFPHCAFCIKKDAFTLWSTRLIDFTEFLRRSKKHPIIDFLACVEVRFMIFGRSWSTMEELFPSRGCSLT